MKKKVTGYLKENSKALITICLAIPFIDVFLMNGAQDVLYFGTIFMYWIVAKIAKKTSKTTFKYSLMLFFSMYVLYIFRGPDAMTENAAVWLVLFMCVGTAQLWKE